ncbi:MAG: sigma-54 dependent transcriptional regulator [Desulfobacteraceae bacterium]
MSLGNVLAVDDEQNIRRLIRNEFTLEGYEVTTAKSGEEGLALIERKQFDVVLLDIKLPKLNGLDVLRKIKEISNTTEVIMITGYGDIQTAVSSLKLGAMDYVTKPFKLDDLLTSVQKAVSDSKAKNLQAVDIFGDRLAKTKSFVLCPSSSMQTVYQMVRRVAKTDHTILIHGETGVGKDVLARQIHEQSLRHDGPFVVVDCGLLTHNLAESELYGHRRGAFSGATEAKIGLVEKSHTGSLFLDEIGNIDLELQNKFLRFVETRRFRKVGETKEQHVDTRIMLATNLDLQKATKEGTLRSDLFYRITEFTIVIPPLRERPDDVLALADYFLQNLPHSGSKMGISKDAQAILVSYPWPGNIRELKAVIGKCALLTDSEVIQPDDLPAHMKARHYESPHKSKTLEDMEKEHIINVLAETEGNQTKASEILGINRKTLYKKIHRYKIFS